MRQYYNNEKFFINHEIQGNRSILYNFLNNLRYNVISLRTFFLIYLYRLLKIDKKQFKYDISICAIFKNESKFLDEWIKLHTAIGIDHFYLYNNNSTDDYLKILNPYINVGLVDLIEFPGEFKQMEAYEDCYLKRKNESNWIAFIDIDEFICPISNENIIEFLKPFNHFPNFAIYMKMFGSNDLKIHDYTKYVVEQYTKCWPKYSKYTKMICNMNFPINEFYSPHQFLSKIFGITIPPINQFKKIIYNIDKVSITDLNNIQLNHYWCKAEDVFFERLENGWAIKRNGISFKKDYFLSHNSLCTSSDFSILKYLK